MSGVFSLVFCFILCNSFLCVAPPIFSLSHSPPLSLSFSPSLPLFLTALYLTLSVHVCIVSTPSPSFIMSFILCFVLSCFFILFVPFPRFKHKQTVFPRKNKWQQKWIILIDESTSTKPSQSVVWVWKEKRSKNDNIQTMESIIYKKGTREGG